MEGTAAVTHIGKYEIVGELGRGGMGVVYRGVDKFIGREVAIKTLTEATPELRQRFLVEARSGILNHKNIVTIYDFGEFNDSPFIVMEYLQGQSLETSLWSATPLKMVDVLDIVRQVCNGLAYAHQKGVIHRDIKPANVMVQPDGQVKLVDFGIARLANASGHTATGAVIGTFNYISPERLKGQFSDGRADIWSAGVLLYRMLTGHLPFGGEDAAALHKAVNEPFTPLSAYLGEYPAGLDQILEHALAKNPADRYGDADDMASDLEALNETLKSSHVGELLRNVRQLLDDDQFTSARPLLLDLQRLAPQDGEVKKLLRDVQARLSRHQRGEQSRVLIHQAEEAVLERRFSEALELYQQANALDADSEVLAHKIKQVQDLKDRAERVEQLKLQAREAHGRRDLVAAKSLIDQALELDSRNTDLRNQRVQILQDVERAAREEARNKLSQTGRDQMNNRQFTHAVQSFREALELDPTDPEVQQLFQSAVGRQEEVRRRAVIDQIVTEIQDCIYRDEQDRALDLIHRALERLPGEATLLRLKAETEAYQREHAVRKLVETTSFQVQQQVLTHPQAALKCVQSALLQEPGDPHLLALEEQVVEQIKRIKVEDLRAHFIKQAQEALAKEDLVGASHLLDAAVIECGESEDLTYLANFVSTKKHKVETNRTVDLATRQARAHLEQENLEAALGVLAPVVQATHDPMLEQMLRQTSGSLNELTRRVDAAETRVRQTSKEDPAQALQLLLSQPTAVQQHSRLRALKAELEGTLAQEQAISGALSEAEQLLETHQMSKVLEPLESAQGVFGESPRLIAAFAELTRRRAAAANALVQSASAEAKVAVLAREAPRALELLEKSRESLPFAEPALQATWQRLAQEAAKMGGRKASTSTIQIVVERRRPNFVLIGGLAAAVLVLIGVILWSFRAVPNVQTGFLQLNATPFAEVVRVVPEQGKPVSLPSGSHETPLRVDGLAPGNYQVTFKAASGATQTITCVVDYAPQRCVAIVKVLGDAEMDEIVEGSK